MSFMDKVRSWFGGGSSDAGDAHAGHEHSAHDHSAHDHSAHEHTPAPPAAPADPAGMPTTQPAPDEDEPA